MHGLDDAIANLGAGSVVLALLAALLLGLRHATDPDHLTAVSTIVLSDEPDQTRRASQLGLYWGLGHATTLLAIGLPLVLLERELPPAIEQWAEFAVGVVIVALALRLLLRWEHDNPRTPAESYGVGLVHGIGGSAGVGILLIGGISGGAAAAAALVLFAGASALSMALVSTGLGYAITRRSGTRVFERLVPVLATCSMLFGAWYAASAI